MSQTLDLVRKSQVLEVHTLVRGGMTIEDACKQVGLSYKTYQRRSHEVLAPIAEEIDAQNKRLTTQLITAREKYVQDMIKAATNNGEELAAGDEKAPPALDWNQRLQIIILLERILGQASSNTPPPPGAADTYLEDAKNLLASGPKTIRVRQTTTVEIEGEAPSGTVVDGTFSEKA